MKELEYSIINGEQHEKKELEEKASKAEKIELRQKRYGSSNSRIRGHHQK